MWAHGSKPARPCHHPLPAFGPCGGAGWTPGCKARLRRRLRACRPRRNMSLSERHDLGATTFCIKSHISDGLVAGRPDGAANVRGAVPTKLNVRGLVPTKLNVGGMIPTKLMVESHHPLPAYASIHVRSSPSWETSGGQGPAPPATRSALLRRRAVPCLPPTGCPTTIRYAC